MIKKRLEGSGLSELLEKAVQYDNMIAYMMSSLFIGKTQELISDVSEKADELLEARFFNESEELHLFYREGELQAAVVVDGEDDMVWEKDYLLSGRFKQLGNLKVKRYISFDKDGQAYVELTRCMGFTKGGDQDGKKRDGESNSTL